MEKTTNMAGQPIKNEYKMMSDKEMKSNTYNTNSEFLYDK